MPMRSIRSSRRTNDEPVTSGTVAKLLEGVEVLTVAQVADELETTVRWVQIMCSQGRLGSKVFGAYAITRAELNAFKKIARPTGRPRRDARP